MGFRIACLAVGLAAVLATPAVAQSNEEVATVEEIVVVARRAGLPMWTVEGATGSVILVGSLTGVPRDYAWRPEALEAATARAERVLYPIEGRASLTDVMRVIWRIRTVSRLPRDTTIADYASPELMARLERLHEGERSQAWRTETPTGQSFDLLKKAGGERRGRVVEQVVRAAARREDVPGESVGFVRGDEMIDNLINAPPATYLPCLDAAARAAEAGPEGTARRLEDWSRLRVPAVLDNPLDQAFDRCWPTGDPEIAPMLRQRWLEATQAALREPGVTLAVAPLRLLAEEGGVLDRLEAEGLEVRGPAWRADQ
jgi:hypothetical protein